MRVDAHGLALSDAVSRILSGSDRDRDVALFRVAEDVLQTLDEHCSPPHPAPMVPEQFRGIPLEMLKDRIAKDTQAAFVFGKHRDIVLTFEETCARRLEVLRGSCRVLLRLREQAHSPERIDAMLDQLGTFAHRAWRITLDLTRDRDWSLRMSRRYDLLPKAWREL